MIYVEVFGGGGSVLLNKERSVREVLNDANGNLINLYRVVREHPDELKDRLLYVMHSREDFKIAQRRLAQKDDILRAADFYQVVRQSYAGNGKQFSAVARSMWTGFPAIDRVAGRLQGVTLEIEDFETIFQRYDSPTTFFYLDPPYFFTEDYYPGNIFLRSDHQRLAAILLRAEGLWLLSYNLCPEVLELYQQPGILIEQVDRINSAYLQLRYHQANPGAAVPVCSPRTRRKENTMERSVLRILGKRGRTTIPWPIRKKLDFGAGDVLLFEADPPDRVVITRMEV